MVVVILNSSSLSQIVQQTTILINEKNFKYFLVVIKVLAKVEGLDPGIKDGNQNQPQFYSSLWI